MTMTTAAKRGLMAGGLLLAVIVAYLAALLISAPAGAQPAPTRPSPPATVGAALPPQGLFERAVSLAESATGGVTVKAEAKNGDGLYEVKVVLGYEEIEVSVNTSTEQVLELEREVETPFDDD